MVSYEIARTPKGYEVTERAFGNSAGLEVSMKNLSLVIPTYRTAHVGGTVDAYASNFARYGHEVPIIIFDDCPFETSEVHLPKIAGCDRLQECFGKKGG